VPLEVLDALRALAKRNGHTLLGEAGLAIEAHLRGSRRRDSSFSC
jgi:hypothetical protein